LQILPQANGTGSSRHHKHGAPSRRWHNPSTSAALLPVDAPSRAAPGSDPVAGGVDPATSRRSSHHLTTGRAGERG